MAVLALSDLDHDKILNSLSIVPRKKGQRKRKGEKELLNIVCAFDIETSLLEIPYEQIHGAPAEDGTQFERHSIMYVWQFQLGPDITIIGRTWDEFRALAKYLQILSDEVFHRDHMTQHPLFVVYVHNLAFEFAYLSGIFRFDNEDCFFRDARKPIYARLMGCMEFRCSYLHSNMSLAKWSENVGSQIRKLDGRKFDYRLQRFPWTPLSDYELQYCIHDVQIIVDCIQIEMDRDGDTLRTLPLTKTGYVRRDIKNALKPQRYSIECMLPDKPVYDLLRRCFRGGDTHANRYRTSIINHNGHAKDIESSYPRELLVNNYPMGPFRKIDDADNTMKRIIRMIEVGNAVIADYTFKGLRLKDPKNPIPYIPIAKSHCYNYQLDNGRILSADVCCIALTEVDFQIIDYEYSYTSVSATNAYTAIKAPLPKAFRDVVIKYYTDKTTLKGIAGSEYEYLKKKGMLNSTYGMTVQQVIHEIIRFDPEKLDWHISTPDDEEAENELSRANFPYQWGVYCTAYARQSLRRGMYCIPKDENGISNLIYCDTDSLKYIGEADFTELNKKLRAQAVKAGGTAVDKKGIRHYIGVFSDEPDWTDFVTHGAKRYAYRDTSGRLHITVSGVEQKPHIYYPDEQVPDRFAAQAIDADMDGTPVKIVPYCVEELIDADPSRDPLDNFQEGMVWREAGGSAIVYHPSSIESEDGTFKPFLYTDPESGNSIEVTASASIVDTTYTLLYDETYRDLVDDCIYWLRYLKETGRKPK